MKIIKILCVQDTRAYEEGPDDRFVPIPGSGIKNNCGRCGREHEIHATVLLEDEKSIMVVGTGCMTADETEIALKVKIVLSAQKSIRKNERVLATQQKLYSEYLAINAKVDVLTIPPIVPGILRRTIGSKDARDGFYCGDAWVEKSKYRNYLESDERAILISIWKGNEAGRHGMTYKHRWSAQCVIDLQNRIEKLKQKIEEKIHGSSRSTEVA